MKLAIYSKIDDSLLSIYDNLNNPKIEGDLLIFDGGSFSDLTERHVLLEDEVDPPGRLEDAQLLDQREKYAVVKVDEIAELKRQLKEAKVENEMNALAIMELAEIMLGGM